MRSFLLKKFDVNIEITFLGDGGQRYVGYPIKLRLLSELADKTTDPKRS